MSTTRMTLGSVLNTVQTTASTVTNVLDTANAAIGMVSSYVEQAATHQKQRQIADNESFLVNLINEKAIEDSNALLAVDKFISQSTRHKELFASRHDAYTALLRPTK